MTVYKYFLKNAFKLKSFLIIYLAIMIIFSIINATGSVKENQNGFQEYKPNLAVINKSNSKLCEHFENYLKTIAVIKEAPENIERAREAVFLEKVDVVIIIPENFEERLKGTKNCIEVLYDRKNTKGHIIENQLYKYFLLLKATQSPVGFDTDLVDRIMKEEVKVIFRENKNNDNDIYRKEWFSSYFRFSGYMITAVLIGIIGMTMSDFQKEEVLRRIQASSIKTLKFQIQIYSGQLSITAIILFIFILLGIIIQKGQIFDGIYIGRYILNLSVFSFSVLSLTFLINNIVKNKVVKNALSTIISLGMSFISGVMIPQKYLGELTLKIAKAMPMYYFVKNNDYNNLASAELYKNIVIQLLFALIFLLSGILVANIKRKRRN